MVGQSPNQGVRESGPPFLFKISRNKIIAKTNIFRYDSLVFVFALVGANFRKRGRRGNSFPLQPLSFPLRPSGLGFFETPAAFRSKWVRAKVNMSAQK